jgi:Fe2+ transport system protein B
VYPNGVTKEIGESRKVFLTRSYEPVNEKRQAVLTQIMVAMWKRMATKVAEVDTRVNQTFGKFTVDKENKKIELLSTDGYLRSCVEKSKIDAQKSETHYKKAEARAVKIASSVNESLLQQLQSGIPVRLTRDLLMFLLLQKQIVFKMYDPLPTLQEKVAQNYASKEEIKQIIKKFDSSNIENLNAYIVNGLNAFNEAKSKKEKENRKSKGNLKGGAGSSEGDEEEGEDEEEKEDEEDEDEEEAGQDEV